MDQETEAPYRIGQVAGGEEYFGGEGQQIMINWATSNGRTEVEADVDRGWVLDHRQVAQLEPLATLLPLEALRVASAEDYLEAVVFWPHNNPVGRNHPETPEEGY